ncbi:FAST kinase domain-containing protein 3, mitochondrial-like [Bacillus rossius redtenbacheri]|uniref:FAST kinase domain-containing protein 3, mitochondrial-like n=1 Tax=Bacillus rossius redtenbacheri TaxID=93214 RepID=UPI002FDCAF91
MSVIVLNNFLSKTNKVFLSSPKILCNIPICCISVGHVYSKIHKKDDLSQTTVILQDGVDMQELPAIVRKVKDVGLITLRNFNSDSDSRKQPESSVSFVQGDVNAAPEETDNSKVSQEAEVNEMVEGFKRCYSPKGVYLLLETIPAEEVTPTVAVQAMKKIIELENNKHYRNPIEKAVEETPENFARTAIFNRLIEIVSSSIDSGIIIEGLKLVSHELVGAKSAEYRKRLCDEVLVRATDGKLDIIQLCEAAKIFSSIDCSEKADNTDKLWAGLVERASEIDASNILIVFRILLVLKKSKKVVLNIIEKKMSYVWWRLSGDAVGEILTILFEAKLRSYRIMNVFSRWINTNIHTVTEDDLLEIVSGFTALNHIDVGVEKALERYVKAKGIRIKNSAVMVAIMDYCVHFHFRSHYILQGCAEYFILNASELSPIAIKTLVVPIGLFDYHPSNAIQFWQTLENVLESKFVQFRPEDLIEVMLTCVYLEKYPVNFVKKIFNPYFLDRIHSQKDASALHQMRVRLKLFDTAMTLECSQYRGPMLPRDHSVKPVWLDGRVIRMVNFVVQPLSTIVGGPDRLSTMVAVPQLPLTDLYVVDLVIHPSQMGGSMLPFNIRSGRNVFVAVLIHIPDHFSSDGKHLIGPQVMRKRHLRKIGFKVVELDYNTLWRMKVHPKELQSYLVESLKASVDAIE